MNCCNNYSNSCGGTGFGGFGGGSCNWIYLLLLSSFFSQPQTQIQPAPMCEPARDCGCNCGCDCCCNCGNRCEQTNYCQPACQQTNCGGGTDICSLLFFLTIFGGGCGFGGGFGGGCAQQTYTPTYNTGCNCGCRSNCNPCC